MTDFIFFIHLISCLFLTGLIWVIQLVHYPTFHYIDQSKFQDFSSFHVKRISSIVVPLMLLELITAIVLVIFKMNFITILNFIALIGIWLSTFLLSVPLHNKLSLEYDSDSITQLVKTNWPRTLLWSVRAVGLSVFSYSLP